MLQKVLSLQSLLRVLRILRVRSIMVADIFKVDWARPSFLPFNQFFNAPLELVSFDAWGTAIAFAFVYLHGLFDGVVV